MGKEKDVVISESTTNARQPLAGLDIKHSRSRRKLFESIGVGAAVAATSSWVTPVIENVVIPAHAQTTTPDDNEESSSSCATFNGTWDHDFSGSSIISRFSGRPLDQSNFTAQMTDTGTAADADMAYSLWDFSLTLPTGTNTLDIDINFDGEFTRINAINSTAFDALDTINTLDFDQGSFRTNVDINTDTSTATVSFNLDSFDGQFFQGDHDRAGFALRIGGPGLCDRTFNVTYVP